MSNFLHYINDDINIKLEMLRSMPDKTKTNLNAINDKLSEFEKKYLEYSKNVKKYIEVKKNTIDLSVMPEVETQKIASLKEDVDDLQYLRKILNPTNTYYEKLEFDTLLYELSHYADYHFLDMNNIINKLYKKFESAGITLTSDDFNVTTYVNEYMTTFIEERSNQDSRFTKLEGIFEKIYWVNPNIIKHIDLNFRKLIKKYKNKLKSHLESIQDEHKRKNGVLSYEDCIKKLQTVHLEYLTIRKHSIHDIIKAADAGEIDVNDYFHDSKAFIEAYNTLVIQKGVNESLEESKKNSGDKAKLYNNIKKLRIILLEYQHYNEFVPFIEYSKGLLKEFPIKKTKKELEDEIALLETDLNRINKIVMGTTSKESGIKKVLSIFEKKQKEEPKSYKQLIADSTVLADKMLELYKNLDSIKFFNKTQNLLNEYVTMDDFLNLYYSYDYFKKKGLKNTFNPQSYEELLEYSNKFDIFSSNPNNIVITSIPIFQEYDVTKVIINKCRIGNINLNEDNLKLSNVNTIIGHVDLFLSVAHVMSNGLKIEDLWFIVEVNKILNKNKTVEEEQK